MWIRRPSNLLAGLGFLMIVGGVSVQADQVYQRLDWSVPGPGGRYGIQELEVYRGLGAEVGLLIESRMSDWQTRILFGSSVVTIPLRAGVVIAVLALAVIGAVVTTYWIRLMQSRQVSEGRPQSR